MHWTPTVILSLLLAGCASNPAAGPDSPVSEHVLVFSVKDDYDAFVTKTEPLAAWIQQHTGVPTRVVPVEDESAAILALANGQATAGFLDGGAAWIAWTAFGVEAIAADAHADGRMHYVATAWVLSGSGLDRIEDLRGTRSCHTGELKSAGMLVPMGYLIGNGYIDMTGLDPDDIASLQQARERFFSQSQIGGEYVGAFECLSTGRGDVAFVRDSTWNEYCTGADARPWCLPRDAYRTLPAPGGPDPALAGGGFARVPSHPVVVAPSLGLQDRQALLAALLAMNGDEPGRQILRTILKTPAIVPTTTEEHLGTYGDVIRHVPGIRAYLENAKTYQGN